MEKATMKTNDKGNKTMKNIRVLIIAFLAFIAFLIICSEPVEGSKWSIFIISRLIGLAIGTISFCLFNFWNKRGLLPDDINDNEA